MHEVLVLMSTYNGAPFLKEQINSILNQQNVHVSLLIRDDGSTDNTVSLLFSFHASHPAQISVIKGRNLGWKASFFELMRTAQFGSIAFDYVAFADQDDIWLPQKLLEATHCLDAIDSDIKLYCSNQYYYKENVNYGLIRRQETIVPTVENCLIRNLAIGCTIVFSPQLLTLATKYSPSPCPPHDFWLYQLSTIFGKVVVDERSYILYRQHENNQIGAKTKSVEIWRRRLQNLFHSIDNRKRERWAHELLVGYATMMTDDVKAKVSLVAHYRQSFRLKLQLMANKNYTTGYKSNDFWLRLRILCGQL
jgi:rhamnosyltransferase